MTTRDRNKLKNLLTDYQAMLSCDIINTEVDGNKYQFTMGDSAWTTYGWIESSYDKTSDEKLLSEELDIGYEEDDDSPENQALRIVCDKIDKIRAKYES